MVVHCIVLLLCWHVTVFRPMSSKAPEQSKTAAITCMCGTDRRYRSAHANKSADLSVYLSRVYPFVFVCGAGAGGFGFQLTLHKSLCLLGGKSSALEKQDLIAKGKEFQAKTETLLPPTNHNSSSDTQRPL